MIRALRLAFLLVLAAATPAMAQGLGDPAPEAKVALLSAQTALGSEGTARLALSIALPDDFKTYWRSPGEGGIAPEIDWSGSTNLKKAELRFPAPHRYETLGLETVGYKHFLMLPVTVEAADPSKPLEVDGRIFMAICSNICVPYQTEVKLSLPPGTAAATPQAPQLAEWYARIPGSPEAAGLALEAVSAQDGPDGLAELRVTVSGAALKTPDLFVEAPDSVEFGAAKAEPGTAPGTTVLVAKQLPGFGTPPKLAPDARLTLTVVDGDRAFEAPAVLGQPVPKKGAAVPIAADRPAPRDGHGGGGLWAMLAVALLGGLVLNVMPCVLPVLSIKLIGVVGHGGQSAGRVRASFLASAAGVLASFWLLAAAAVALSAVGRSVAWGMQFQQPLFLAVLVLVLTVFALNMAGGFEIALPWKVQRRLAALGPRHGTQPAGQESLAGHFGTGMLATVLATPCSAPFVGTGLSFAFLQGPGAVLAIFTALGVGLAAPYLLLAALPGLVRHLPRPGAWMLTVRKVLALLLAATAVWLLWVLVQQVGRAAVSVMAVAVAGLVLAVLLRGRLPRALRLALPAVLALAVLVPAAVPVPSVAAPVSAGFDAAAIAPLVDKGQTVFVDVTAAWCVTCQVNKQTVLQRDPVKSRLFGDSGVTFMEADWTRADPKITDFLASHERFGAPFNVVYGPGAPQGIALPELLSSDAVLSALNRARTCTSTPMC